MSANRKTENWSELSKTVPLPDSRFSELVIRGDPVAFGIDGVCMEPAFPHGSYVFAVKSRLPFIRIGTPVIIETTSGHRICKLWNGNGEGAIFLKSLNTGEGIMEKITLLNSEVTGIWIVVGSWFEGRLLQAPDKEATNIPNRTGKTSIAAQKKNMPAVVHAATAKPARKPTQAASKRKGA